MPELPDVITYLDALERFVVGHHLERVTLRSPFVLRSVDPPMDCVNGQMELACGRVFRRRGVLRVFRLRGLRPCRRSGKNHRNY